MKEAILILLAALVLAIGVEEYRIRGLNLTIVEQKSTIESQNSAIELAAAAGKTDKAESDGRALGVKSGAAELKAKLPKGHGPKAQNDWFDEVYP